MRPLTLYCVIGTLLSSVFGKFNFSFILKKAQGDLKFRDDGTFRIVQFTDLHYGESPEKDVNTSIVQATILAAEKPDLVIMTVKSETYKLT